MKTIPRNSKRLTAIFAHAADCRIYTLENEFKGRSCSSDAPEVVFRGYPRATLSEREPGRYTVSLHSNHWYEFSSEEPSATDS